jgi:hypothetical protein
MLCKKLIIFAAKNKFLINYCCSLKLFPDNQNDF